MTFRRAVPAAAVVALAALPTFWHRPSGAPPQPAVEASAFGAGEAERAFMAEPSRGRIVPLPPATTTTVPPPANPPPAVHRFTGNRPRPQVQGSTGGAWACIRQHESGGDYARNSGNNYYGAYQWLPSTWNAAVRLIGRPEYANGRADLAPPAVQDAAAVAWQAAHGWGQWPATSRMCGLR